MNKTFILVDSNEKGLGAIKGVSMRAVISRLNGEEISGVAGWSIVKVPKGQLFDGKPLPDTFCIFETGI